MHLGLELRCELRLETRCQTPHSPMKNSEVTRIANDINPFSLERIMRKGKMSVPDQILHTEAHLLRRWGFSGDWKNYLDSPLISHADVALVLRSMGYDAAVGVASAGVPYAELFGVMGFPVFEIDYSHYKRDMEKPEIGESELEMLKSKRKVLLADIDFVSGRTLTTVTKYLRGHGVPVEGAYIGLCEWPAGIDTGGLSVSADTVDFDKLWKQCGVTRQLRGGSVYRQGILPKQLRVFTPNNKMDDINSLPAQAAARRVAQYLLAEDK